MASQGTLAHQRRESLRRNSLQTFGKEFTGQASVEDTYSKVTGGSKNNTDSYGPGALVDYDTNRPFKSLSRWRGTVTRRIIRKRKEFYIYVMVYFVSSFMHKSLPRLPASLLATPGTLVVIMLVFYNQQAYTRFTDQYNASMKIILNIKDAIMQCCMHFAKDKRKSVTVSKYLNAAHVYCYLEMNEEYGHKCNAAEFLVAHHVITSVEKKILDESVKGDHHRSGCVRAEICVGWAMNIIKDAEDEKKISPPLFSRLVNSMIEILDNIEIIYNFRDLPIPFMYFHFQAFFLFMYCVMLAYASGVNDNGGFGWIPGGVGIFGLLGLREVSIALADPYGRDDSDLPVIDYITNMLQDTTILLNQLYLRHAMLQHAQDMAAKKSVG